MNVPNSPINVNALAGVDIDVLRTFVAIADTGSFSKAAEKVFRTPSAVSMQIKKLEENLRVSVFARDSRSVAVTSEGEVLLSYARRILAISNEMMARFIMPEMEGTVCLGAPDNFGDRLLPDILKRFDESHPNVAVDVIIDSSPSLIERFENGQIDVMLYTSSDRNPLEPTAQIVHEEELAWAGVKNGCAYKKSPLPVSTWEPTCSWRRSAMRALDKVAKPYRIAYMSAQSVAQRAAVIADLAVAPMPVCLIQPPMVRLGEKDGLPELDTYQVRMLIKENAGCCSQAVADHVVNCFDDL